MTYICLKVPSYLAQFYRNRNPQSPLTEQQAVSFSPFQHEHVLMSSSLVLADGSEPANPICFPQRQWTNMLRGRQPQGGKRILQRDPEQWLTTQEVCVLINDRANAKTDGFDYLCIEIPRTILVGDQLVSTNASFVMPRDAATQLQTMMRQELVRCLVDWIRRERHWCNMKGVERDLTAVIDHFFYHYQICLGTNMRDRESLRRMASRWIEEALVLPHDYLTFDDEDAMFIYEKERDAQDVPIETLLKELKVRVKKS